MLSGAQQEVPDFLNNYASGCAGGAEYGGTFGGQDARNNAAQAEEEDWD